MTSRSTGMYRILIPIDNDTSAPALAPLAAALLGNRHGEIVLVGSVTVPPERNVSEGASEAQARRQTLVNLKARYADLPLRVKPRIRVGHTPWRAITTVATSEAIDLMLVAWNGDPVARLMGVPLEVVLAETPCDIALARGAHWRAARRILLPMRGGPYADLALTFALALAETDQGTVTVLHADPPGDVDSTAGAFLPVLKHLPRSRQIHAQGDVAESIARAAAAHDAIVMGASARVGETGPKPLGPLAARVARSTTIDLIMVKSPTAYVPAEDETEYHDRALSILTDQWFAENTFDADEFADLSRLVSIKRERGLTISLGLPALDEEETVGKVIRTLQRGLMDKVPLLDEIMLIDSGSADRTREIARRLGVPIYVHQEILPEHGAHRGKGEALWKSLHVLKGDLIAWIDTDIVNIHPRFVYGVLGPLLQHDTIQYVKGFYRRPIRVGDKLQAGGGGRVTELVTRPLFNLFFPELSGLVQPLSGEYAGRRSALERVPFFTGYGVETGLLIDLLNEFGLGAIAQVDLQERIHHNQSLSALSKMSFAILQVIFRRLEDRHKLRLLEEVNRSMKLIRHEPGRYYLDIEEIGDVERPPIITLPEYVAARQQATKVATTA
ncbi:MAG TPA: glucosyl-3-phosphoglycerate synthase [Anaerolineae bacterium]|nr:glucosyl-3-phosphoglycerate synthase [Anaerolineae bacterium]